MPCWFATICSSKRRRRSSSCRRTSRYSPMASREPQVLPPMRGSRRRSPRSPPRCSATISSICIFPVMARSSRNQAPATKPTASTRSSCPTTSASGSIATRACPMRWSTTTSAAPSTRSATRAHSSGRCSTAAIPARPPAPPTSATRWNASSRRPIWAFRKRKCWPARQARAASARTASESRPSS